MGQAYEGALALEAWLEEHPDAPVDQRIEALRWAAHGRTITEDPDLARGHLEEALGLTTDDPWLHYAHGTACNSMGDYELALESYSTALALDAGHVKAMQWRGFTYSLMGRAAEAAQDYEAALTMIESADEARLAEWGADRAALASWTKQQLDGLATDGR